LEHLDLHLLALHRCLHHPLGLPGLNVPGDLQTDGVSGRVFQVKAVLSIQWLEWDSRKRVMKFLILFILQRVRTLIQRTR
jgi:hypothetical protein